MFTVGLFSAKRREFIHVVNQYTGLEPKPESKPEPGQPLEIPQISQRELGLETFAIVVPEAQEADGNVTAHELVVIDQVVRRIQPRCSFEIGTFDGRTTLNIAANSPADTTVLTLDLPPAQVGETVHPLAAGESKFIEKKESGSRFSGTREAARIRQLWGDSATFDFSSYEGGVDFIFVDGSHAPEYVINDTKVALKLLRGGRGAILWHDYGSKWWKGLTQSMNQLYKSDPRLAGLRHIQGTTLVCLILP